MPNYQGNYTLKEIAGLIGVSSAWINKVQERTGIGGSKGTSGKKVSFPEDEIEMLKNAKFLRDFNYPLDDIALMYKDEKRMIEIAGRVEHHPDSKAGCRFIIHPFGFRFPMYELSEQDISDEEAEEYKMLAEKIFKASQELTRRIDVLCDFKKKLANNKKGE